MLPTQFYCYSTIAQGRLSWAFNVKDLQYREELFPDGLQIFCSLHTFFLEREHVHPRSLVQPVGGDQESIARCKEQQQLQQWAGVGGAGNGGQGEIKRSPWHRARRAGGVACSSKVINGNPPLDPDALFWPTTP